MRHAWLGLVAVLLVGACAVEDLSTASSYVSGPATVSTDKTSYTETQDVIVSWSNLTTPLSTTDWVAIAPSGSALTAVSQWAYTNVARAYSNDTYTLEGESAPFTIAMGTGGTVSVTHDQPTYHLDQTMVASFSGLPGNARDYIAIAPAGSSDMTITSYRYTNGQAAGSVTFANGIAYTGLYRSDGPELNSGLYVMRAYLNDTYTKVAETAPFQIGATITTSASMIPAFGSITVSWTNMPGNRDWIALAPDKSALSANPVWLYTDNSVNGSLTFNPSVGVAGDYRARAFTNDSQAYQGESPVFTVTGGGGTTVTLTTDHTTYAPGAPIVVSWTGAPGNDLDWVDVAPQGTWCQWLRAVDVPALADERLDHVLRADHPRHLRRSPAVQRQLFGAPRERVVHRPVGQVGNSVSALTL